MKNRWPEWISCWVASTRLYARKNNFLLLRSFLIVRLVLLDFLHCLIHELYGFFAMSSLVWGGFVQLCSGLLQVSIGCAHVRLMTRHLLALGVTSQRIQAQPEKQDCPAAGRNNFLNHRNSSSGLKTQDETCLFYDRLLSLCLAVLLPGT